MPGASPVSTQDVAGSEQTQGVTRDPRPKRGTQILRARHLNAPRWTARHIPALGWARLWPRACGLVVAACCWARLCRVCLGARLPRVRVCRSCRVSMGASVSAFAGVRTCRVGTRKRRLTASWWASVSPRRGGHGKSSGAVTGGIPLITVGLENRYSRSRGDSAAASQAPAFCAPGEHVPERAWSWARGRTYRVVVVVCSLVGT